MSDLFAFLCEFLPAGFPLHPEFTIPAMGTVVCKPQKSIESHIKDPNITRLVRRMLKAGIMKEFQYEETEEGSGQGSVCSPVIANIYMHYVLVWWFREKIQPLMKGYSGMVVYADDFVVCFEYKEEAEMFYEHLKRRMEH
mgnify:CR=1 FL=1